MIELIQVPRLFAEPLGQLVVTAIVATRERPGSDETATVVKALYWLARMYANFASSQYRPRLPRVFADDFMGGGYSKTEAYLVTPEGGIKMLEDAEVDAFRNSSCLTPYFTEDCGILVFDSRKATMDREVGRLCEEEVSLVAFGGYGGNLPCPNRSKPASGG